MTMAETLTTPTVVLELQGICKSFNIGQANETEVLHGIDLTLMPGEFCAVMGPSGSGKSTLLNTIGLLDRPTVGSLRINGIETNSLSDDKLTDLRGHSIGFVFQYHHLLSAFSALENVMMPLFGDAGFANPNMRRRATDLLDLVGLSPWLHAPASHLSGGQQQRVAVARALAMQPALVLADEPTGNLDSKSADSVFALLRDMCIQHRTAVLFVTHNPLLSARCDRTIEVVDGKVLTHSALNRVDS
jgi:lipoprotein-releasing system ATP-binding protein